MREREREREREQESERTGVQGYKVQGIEVPRRTILARRKGTRSDFFNERGGGAPERESERAGVKVQMIEVPRRAQF